MSDQPGIPAITVFPPFNPSPRQPAPMAEPARDQAPASAPDDPQPEPQATGGDVAAPARDRAPASGLDDPQPEPQATGGDVAAPTVPAPWDFAPPGEAEQAGDAPISEDEDLPWLEVPEPARAREEDTAAPELKADEAPNWMDWVRDAGPHDEAGATPIGDLQPDDAQPWAPETETAADDWASSAAAPDAGAPAPSTADAGEPQRDPWQAPPSQEGGDPQPDPWQAPPATEQGEPQPDPWHAPVEEYGTTEYDVPEPELYDLPQVGAAAEAAAEPEWELPAQQPAADAPPAWDSFAPAAAEPEPQAAAGPFAAVADRLRQIADALSADPNAFLAGAQGGGDPLALLVAGFVLGYNARQGS